jgi:hypothetical protein
LTSVVIGATIYHYMSAIEEFGLERLHIPEPRQARGILGAYLYSAETMLGVPTLPGTLPTHESILLGAYLRSEVQSIYVTPSVGGMMSPSLRERVDSTYDTTRDHVAWAQERKIPITELVETLAAIGAVMLDTAVEKPVQDGATKHLATV